MISFYISFEVSFWLVFLDVHEGDKKAYFVQKTFLYKTKRQGKKGNTQGSLKILDTL